MIKRGRILGEEGKNQLSNIPRVTIYPLKSPKHEVVHKLVLAAHVRGQSSNATFLLLVACVFDNVCF